MERHKHKFKNPGVRRGFFLCLRGLRIKAGRNSTAHHQRLSSRGEVNTWPASMKLYKNLVNSLAFTLQEIFIRHRYADKALEKLFKKNPQWGSRDPRFVAGGGYD